MKLDLSGAEEFNPRLYDRDNGPGAAQTAIDAVRASGLDAIELRAAHEVGKQAAAETVKSCLHKATTFADGVMTLGLADVAEPLGEAVRKAEDHEQ
jgi:hypothetical protein